MDMLEKNGSDDKNCSAVCGEGGQDSSPMRDSRGNVKTSGALTSRKFMHVDDPGAAATRLASEGDGLVSCNKDGRAGPLATGSQSSLGKKTAEPESNDLGRYSEVGGEVSLRCEQASDSSLPLMTGAEIEDGVEDAGPGSSPPSRCVFSSLYFSNGNKGGKYPRLPSRFLCINCWEFVAYCEGYTVHVVIGIPAPPVGVHREG